MSLTNNLSQQLNVFSTLDCVKEGSGNIFADLGLPDPEERLAKAELCFAIGQQIKARGWTQAQAARHLGTDQPHVSDLLRGRVRGVSVERLLGYLTRLDQDVQITVSPRRGAQGKIAVVVE